jgi:hypothetical protein
LFIFNGETAQTTRTSYRLPSEPTTVQFMAFLPYK